MTPFPVRFSVQRPERFTRLQLAVRFVAFLALGMLGLSFGSVFAFAYLALPVYAAARLAAGDSGAYLDTDGRSIVKALRWFAAVSAWAGLVAETLPSHKPDDSVDLDVTPGGHPTPRTAIWRVLTGLPSALVLMLLGWLGVFVWLWAALSILIRERVGRGAFDYLVGLQRWSIRLLAYQASLVEDYPPFALSDAPPALPEARTT